MMRKMEDLGHTKMMHDFDAGPMWNMPFMAVKASTGRRFMDEKVDMAYVNNYLRGPEDAGVYCQVFDANYVDTASTWEGCGAFVDPEGLQNYMPELDIEHTGVIEGLIATYQADTLEELAEKLGIADVDAFLDEVARYNERRAGAQLYCTHAAQHTGRSRCMVTVRGTPARVPRRGGAADVESREGPPLDQAEFPFEDFYQLYAALDRLCAVYAKRHGESVNSFYVLDTLYRNPLGISQVDICAELMLSKQTVGSVMARLQQRGLAELVPSPTDGRSKLCRLTAAGSAYCKPIIEKLGAIERRCAEQVGAERLGQMRETMRTFTDLMERELRQALDR